MGNSFRNWLIFLDIIFRHPSLLPYNDPLDYDELQIEFHLYQLLKDEDIPEDVWKKVKSKDRRIFLDQLWFFIGSMKNPDGTKRFAKLFEVAMVILCIPHSNAVEECIFSQVKKNKTAARSNLGLDESVGGIVTTKLVIADKNIPRMEIEPQLLNTLKLAAMKYNRAHRKDN